MFKNILISGLLCTFLSAESFDNFLQMAIKNSPYLHSNAIALEQTKKQGEVLTRYKNPNLELELSSFMPDTGSNDSGYKLGYTQPIRLWGIGNDKKAFVDASMKNESASYVEKKAIFTRDISLLYTLYSQSKMLLELGNKELEIAKKIYDISVARFDGGTISRGLKLQAQVDYEMSESARVTLTLQSMNSYYSLLTLAGLDKEIEIQEDYNFSINESKKTSQNPTINLLKTKQLKALADAKVNSSSVEFIDIYAEIESESDQDVLRVGLNFPLAFFNNKSQEKQIASLQASREELLLKNEENRLNVEQIKLQKERKILLSLNKSNQKTLKTQLELLTMYEDGYKIANVNLLQLQDIKNKVIATKRVLIQTHTVLNQNAILSNYIQGNYND